ncbi:MAG: Demethylmenaquinone methyltransferase [Gemmatimonadaceae bacterium]|nr:Demethylmenaquinone methyltransferase [Gemmatimonadaceae bacterium]
MNAIEAERVQAQVAAAGGEGKRAYVQRMFSDIAPRYDLLNHLLSFNIDRRWRAAALEDLGWRERPEGRYLDLCAGTLDVGVQLAGEKGFRGTVASADFAEPMLRSGLWKRDGRPVVPVVADAQELPVADHAFDGAIVAFGIRNLADLDAGLREARRVLAPGGRFVILEFSTPRSAFVRAGYHAYFHHVLPLVGKLVSHHPTAYRYLPESVATFPEERVLAARMEGAGFTRVRWRTLTWGVVAIHVGEQPVGAGEPPHGAGVT